MMDQGEGFVKSDADTSIGKRGGGDKQSRAVMPVNTVMMKKLVHGTLGLVVHRHRYSNVTMVGFVNSYKETNSKVEFRLSDGFGSPVLVQLWKAADESGDGSQSTGSSGLPLKDGQLVRAFGHPRFTPAVAAEKVLLATKILPVTDLNELTMHILDVVTSKAAIKKRKENVIAGLPDVHDFPGSQAQPADSFNNTFTNTNMNRSVAAATAPNSQTKPVVTQSPKDLVLKAISKDNSAQGISFAELESGLRSLNMKIIKEAVEYLLREGHIYSTTDDSHFKSLDG